MEYNTYTMLLNKIYKNILPYITHYVQHISYKLSSTCETHKNKPDSIKQLFYAIIISKSCTTFFIFSFKSSLKSLSAGDTRETAIPCSYNRFLNFSHA